MAKGIQLIVYPVKDLAAAKRLFGTFLGTEPYADAPYYVGYRVGDQEIGLDPNAHAKGITAALGYVEVDDIKASLKRLVAAGGQTQQDVNDVGGGKLIAIVRDADGNFLGLVQSPK
jgi:predicted enzyme related to lactoylglutathione lyase